MEGCATADMVWLAVRLSEEGIGDYWEDVDQYVRNHLIEHQVLRRDILEEIVASAPKVERQMIPGMEITDNIIDRNIGAFVSVSDPTGLYGWWTMCCNANMPQGMYKAWDGIARHYGDGFVRINLLLNRATPWLDIDSYLPYEGKLVIKNKSAKLIHVRIPQWVDRNAIKCSVNNKKIALNWLDNYLMISPKGEKDVIAIEFPMVERVEKFKATTFETTYTCTFKGNTLVDISPRPKEPHWDKMADDAGDWFKIGKQYPIYQRDYYKKTKAPIKKIKRYSVAGKRLP